MAHMIVEQNFSAPLTEEVRSRSTANLVACLEAHGARWVRSYVSTDRLRMMCEFEAADAEAVRASYRSAGMTFARVWVAELYQP